MADLILFKLDRCRRLLSECKTAKDAKAVSDLAEAARVYAKRVGASVDVVNQAVEYKVRAERRLGEILSGTKKASGGDAQRTRYRKGIESPPTLHSLGISLNTSSRAQKLASIPASIFEAKLAEAKSEARELTTVAVLREGLRGQIAERNEAVARKKLEAPAGRYHVVVVDPPWPVEKIERDCRGNQTGFDYPTETVEEIKARAIPAAEHCHVFLWTTQRFLPAAFDVLNAWKSRYVCTFVWHKPGGYQPIGLPQYNAEFCLYARIGSPRFSDTKSFPVCFEAPRGKHSEKPEEFYATLRRVTEGKRIDLFGRKPREGFDVWGNEA